LIQGPIQTDTFFWFPTITTTSQKSS
jgi:hypothetical protein